MVYQKAIRINALEGERVIRNGFLEKAKMYLDQDGSGNFESAGNIYPVRNFSLLNETVSFSNLLLTGLTRTGKILNGRRLYEVLSFSRNVFRSMPSILAACVLFPLTLSRTFRIYSVSISAKVR
jgi:hypothetical protein